MPLSLDKQYGPFSLKVWLIIGVGGIGIGLFVASRQNSGKGVTSDKGLSAPPGVIFERITIGLEHVPDITKPVAPIKPAPASPIMPSNPAAKPAASTTPVVSIPKPTAPTIPAPVYTAVAPTVWSSFIGGRPITAATVAAANAAAATQPKPIYTGLDASGNAYF